MDQFESNYLLSHIYAQINDFIQYTYSTFLTLLLELDISIDSFNELNQLVMPLESMSNWLVNSDYSFQVDEFVRITGSMIYIKELLEQSNNTLGIIKSKLDSSK